MNIDIWESLKIENCYSLKRNIYFINWWKLLIRKYPIQFIFLCISIALIIQHTKFTYIDIIIIINLYFREALNEEMLSNGYREPNQNDLSLKISSEAVDVADKIKDQSEDSNQDRRNSGILCTNL